MLLKQPLPAGDKGAGGGMVEGRKELQPVYRIERTIFGLTLKLDGIVYAENSLNL